MYIESVPDRQSPPAVLLRESYRVDGKVKKRTLANLSAWPGPLVEGLRTLLKGGVAVERADEALTIARSLPHGHVAAVLGTAERLGLPKLLLGRRSWPGDERARDLVLAMIAERIIRPASKLATLRALNAETAASSLADRLGLGEVAEYEIYAALDWLLERQPHIEPDSHREGARPAPSQRGHADPLRRQLVLSGGPLLRAGPARPQPRPSA